MGLSFTGDRSPQLLTGLASGTAVLLTPAGYLAYVVTVRTVQGYPPKLEPLFSPPMILYYVVLSLTGVIVVLGWRWRLRIAPLATVGGLLVWPWLYLSIPIGSPGYASVPLVAACILVGTEGGLVRDPSAPGSAQVLDGYVFAAGLFHLVAGIGLHIYTRRLILVEPSYGILGMVLGTSIYLVLGSILVVTGALPVIFWNYARLVLPALATVGWFVWGLYGTWLQRGRFPLGEFTGFGWFSIPLRPYPDYVIGITELLVLVLAVAGVEYIVRTVVRRIGGHGQQRRHP